jgi:preprotein translocase subunit SecE
VAVEVAAARPGFPARVVGTIRAIPGFYRDVVAEMKKVTWPDRPQVQQLSIGVIVLSLFIGLVIFLLDLLLGSVLVNGIARLFGS